ncbi:nitrate/nitrite transporter [Sanguibacter antarcticus]|uniref:NNP family nitrate/nitrite transporter-like MFS transporter n=1 Tax=Sanguibacter antarcticus TaxID=372484 RepID=A0A2A9E6I0_9MICO|nr:MFS transporter [Sanguibacter antarcticus]PFG34443.1 NNP family nitrate/nitrite transporter-like MFS transporter [Sanguibacter antarcticus]
MRTSEPVPAPSAASRLAPDLSNWDPEDPQTWDSKIAWRTLWVSTYSLTLAFATWYLVSAIAPRLTDIGYDLSKAQLYWLAAIPGLAGGLLRIVWMFLPPLLGTKRLVGWSSVLLILPMVGWAVVVHDPSTPYWLLLSLAAATGIGGGVFSGYMPSTSYFFPKRMAGTALGIQAGIGNFGVSLIQLLGPWIVGFGLLGTAALTPQSTQDGQIYLHNVGLILIPWAVLAAILAFALLRSVPITANFKQQLDIFDNKHTWILTTIYLMTFGAFSGLAAQTPLIINNVYGSASEFAGMDDLPRGLTYAFIGPLIGSAARVAFGPLCDRYGGARWTFLAGVGMAISTGAAVVFLTPENPDEFKGFLACLFLIFLFAGIGNAGTFKQMPMILPPRQAGGVIGWTSSVAAFGPFLVGMSLSVVAPAAFFTGVAVFCVFCAALTWYFYARPGAPNPS